MSEEITKEEYQLLKIIKDLKPYENVEIKRDERGDLVYVYTHKEKYTFLFNKYGT